jgi:energy-converting hydrogenase B subunit D
MISAGLMNTLQVVVLAGVAAGATVVVRTRTRVRQVLALGVYGMLLAILFLVFQAPDVTLSELTVGAVALSMIVPAAALAALGLAAGIAAMVPKVAAGVEAAAARFQDQHAYIATVLAGARVTRAVPLYPVSPADVTVASVVTALCSALGAAALALTALYWRRLPLLRRGYEPGAGLTVAIRRFQSGVINDYITWLVAGVAALGGLLALVIR